VKIYDEQGRININVTGLKQLELLFGGKIADASGAAKIVNAWKSSGGQLLPGPEQTDEDAYFKNAPFRVTEELMFALSYLYKDDPEAARAKVFEDYSRLKDLITVFPQQAAKPVININTAGKDALTLTGVFTGANSNDAASLVEKIIQYRDDSAKYFTQTSNINDILSSASVVLTDQEQGVLNKIKDLLIVKSSMFRIQSNAEVRGVRKSITAVYDRDSKKIVYWRQN
jgi:hypothetical protein